MTHQVTSWFQSQTQLTSPDNLVRKFYIGSSDYSSYVLRWPSITRRWDDLRPISLNMQLGNADGTFGMFRTDPTLLQSDVTMQIGYTHPTSGDELYTVYAGVPKTITYAQEKINMQLQDKFKKLTERIMGSSDAPLSYTGSSYLPSDLVWYWCVSYGGFSSIESTSNPDIDYTGWLAWANVFSTSNILAQANFEGKKVMDGLRTMARITQSAIYVDDNKVTFKRFNVAETAVSSLDAGNIRDLTVILDDGRIINRQYVQGAYDVTSKAWYANVFTQDSASVNSYGLREYTEKDENVWYPDSTGMLDYSQRIISIFSQPYDQLEIETQLNGLAVSLGETIYVEDTFHGIANAFRVMGMTVDTDTGRIKLLGDRSQYFNAFILDTSSLDDTTAVLT